MPEVTGAPIAGGYTTPTDSRPFMKPRKLKVLISGLRPGVNLYAFFNDVNVSQYCRPATIPATGGNVSDDSNWTIEGAIGDQLTSDSAGRAAFYFYVPASTFLVGTGTLVVKDAVDDTYTTKAEVNYNTLNYPSNPDDPYATRLVQVEASTTTSSNKNSTPNGGFLRPFAQTFFVSSNMARGKDGIYIPKCDLYFESKDDTYAVIVELRATDEGKPNPSPLPLARVRLFPNDISTTGATSVVFPGPVFLQSGKEYALTIVPDGAANKFNVSTASIGSLDNTTAEFITNSVDKAKLWLPTNGSEWTPITNEVLKFKLYMAEFTANNGYLTLSNKDYEFLTLSNTSGEFLPGEYAAQIGSNLAGTAIANSSSFDLIGAGTSFVNSFNANDFVVILNSNTDIDIIRVQSVSNNTFMTLSKKPSFSNPIAGVQKTPIGQVDVFNSGLRKLTLVDSTASNTTFVFSSNSAVVGADSGAYATISSVDNRGVNHFKPVMFVSSPIDTNLSMFADIIDESYTSQGEIPANIKGSTIIEARPAIVASKSNELQFYAGKKSLNMNLVFSTSASTLSPLADMAIPSIVLYENKINANTTNEHTNLGGAKSRYVRKPVSLRDDLDAEDMVVYLTAWRPPNTEVAVYAKFLNSADPDNLSDKQWTRLQSSSNNVFSDAVDQADYVELKYTLPASPEATLQTGVVSVNTTSTALTGVGTTFNTQIAAGDIIRIDSGANSEIRKVLTITNDTQAVLDSNSAFTTTSGSWSKITTPYTAFKNQANDVIRYYSPSGVYYDTYKTYAIKIVLLSDFTYITPLIDDIRVLSVS